MTINSQSYWSQTGAECYHSNANCVNCPIFLEYGLAHQHPMADKQCRQPETNKQLINAGYLPPEPEIDKADRLVAVFQGPFSVFG